MKLNYNPIEPPTMIGSIGKWYEKNQIVIHGVGKLFYWLTVIASGVLAAYFASKWNSQL